MDDRDCQWSDIPEELSREAALSMLEKGKFLLIISGWWCKLEKQDQGFLQEFLGMAPLAAPKAVAEPETSSVSGKVLQHSRLGTSAQMERFRTLVKAGFTRAAWVAEEMGLKAYQVSRLAKRAIRSGWLVKQGMDYAMRHATGRPRKL